MDVHAQSSSRPYQKVLFLRPGPGHLNSGRASKVTERAQNADFRHRKPLIFRSPGNSSTWRAQETAENRRFREICRKPQIGVRHLRSVTVSSALLMPEEAQKNPQK